MPESKKPNQTDMAVRHIRKTEQFLKKHEIIESLPNILMDVPYRMQRQFQGYVFQDEVQSTLSFNDEARRREIDELWLQWRPTYDPYSGENLTAVAPFQAERYGIRNFPKEETTDYQRLVKVMERWGQSIKLVVADMGEENALRILKREDVNLS